MRQERRGHYCARVAWWIALSALGAQGRGFEPDQPQRTNVPSHSSVLLTLSPFSLAHHRQHNVTGRVHSPSPGLVKFKLAAVPGRRPPARGHLHKAQGIMISVPAGGSPASIARLSGRYRSSSTVTRTVDHHRPCRPTHWPGHRTVPVGRARLARAVSSSSSPAHDSDAAGCTRALVWCPWP